MVFASAALSDLMKKGEDKSRFTADVIGMVLLIVGGWCSLLHLALPENVMAAVTNIFSFSGISIELVLLGITFILAFIYAIMLKRETVGTARKVVAVAGIVAAVLLAFFCGHGYVMVGRPLWNTNLLPFAYLGTALGTGGFLFACIQSKRGNAVEDVVALKTWYLATSVISAVTVAAYVVFLAASAGLKDAALIYAVVALLGCVVALTCGISFFLKPAENKVFAIACLGAVTSLIAGLAVRMLMWAVCAGYLELFSVATTTRAMFL